MTETLDRALLEGAGFQWSSSRGRYYIPIPDRANIAADTVGRHAQGARRDHPALVFEGEDGSVKNWTFAELDDLANRFAASLRALGVLPGSRVAVHTGSRPETAIAHLAIYKLGAIAVTLSQLYGPDTLAHVLGHSGASVIVTQGTIWQRFRRESFPALEHRIVIGAAALNEREFRQLCAEQGRVVTADTVANDPALLMYSSGSTGLPKGILHAHRILHAYLPTVRLFYDLSMNDADAVFWTPADWAWVGGLLDLLLPAWAHGQTVVTTEHRFDAEWAFGFMGRHRVTHSFMTPTALKRLAEIAEPRRRWPLALRVVCTGGEPLPGETLRWTEEDLGVVCNEFYGLTEFNHLVGNCRRLYPIRPGSMGKPYPGHETTLVDEAGKPVIPGDVGEIVAPADDPTLFLSYWKQPGVTDRLRLGPWLRTGDLARQDADGYVWYQGRNDDLIKSAGYRIGPAEVEDCLVRHSAVAEAAVVGSPDPERGMIVKAFVRLSAGFEPSETLVESLKAYVKSNLAAYKYPRAIEFVTEFPLTSSGKIRRGELRRREAGSGEG